MTVGLAAARKTPYIEKSLSVSYPVTAYSVVNALGTTTPDLAPT